MKKAEGLSLTTVVIAAIVLIVLIVLILIFSGRIELFNKGLTECPPNTEKIGKDDMDGSMCPGFKLPIKVINQADGKEIIYCCKPTPEPEKTAAPKHPEQGDELGQGDYDFT